MNENSNLLSITMGLMYPFVILTSIYIIVNGHLTPGGGFQGGAMMSSVFISKYLMRPIEDIRMENFHVIEKLSFVFIVGLPILFFIIGLNQFYPFQNTIYMIAMNVLISIKVCCGLSIVFFRFVFYESR